MSFTPVSELTFGDTPAAMYLARKVNETKNTAILRNVGRAITTTSRQCRQLVKAYETGNGGDNGIDAKTLANCLRLMREEIVNRGMAITDPSDAKIIGQLCRNVQIGYIKQAIRLATVARKAERVMDNPEKKSSGNMQATTGGCSDVQYFFVDHQTKKNYLAGMVITDKNSNEKFTLVHKFRINDVETVTSTLLHERSMRRCIRLKKPHTL